MGSSDQAILISHSGEIRSADYFPRIKRINDQIRTALCKLQDNDIVTNVPAAVDHALVKN